jgi:hypothetical protein
MPSQTPEAVQDMANRCWDADPARRGTFVDVVAALGGDPNPEQQQQATFGGNATPPTTKKAVFSTRTLCDVSETIISMSLVHGRTVWISTSRPRIALFDLQDDALKNEVDTCCRCRFFLLRARISLE